VPTELQGVDNAPQVGHQVKQPVVIVETPAYFNLTGTSRPHIEDSAADIRTMLIARPNTPLSDNCSSCGSTRTSASVEATSKRSRNDLNDKGAGTTDNAAEASRPFSCANLLSCSASSV
jgi:hypothetical protein